MTQAEEMLSKQYKLNDQFATKLMQALSHFRQPAV